MDYILRRQEPQTCRKQRNRQSLAKGGQRRSQLWLVAVADCVFDWRGSSSWLACFWGSKFCKVLLSKQIMFSPWRPTQLPHFKCSVIECLVAQQDGCLSHTFLWLVAVTGRANAKGGPCLTTKESTCLANFRWLPKFLLLLMIPL